MDIKEIGAGAVVLIGGVAYTVSEGGLADALNEDVKHITEVSLAERPAYMNGIVNEFSENFSNYIVQTEGYDFVGQSTFSSSPNRGQFVEVVEAQETTDKANLQAVTQRMKDTDFCAQAEMTIFTEKGWSYEFTMKDAQGRKFYAITCSPNAPTLKGAA